MDFDHVGSKCNHAGCNKQDFLPFRCHLCSGQYCLSHASGAAHGCASQPGAVVAVDRRVVTCPMCAKSIELSPTEDVNVTWSRHERADCRPAERVKRVKKPRCPVKGCKEKLLISNTVKCRECAIDHWCVYSPGRPRRAAPRTPNAAACANAASCLQR